MKVFSQIIPDFFIYFMSIVLFFGPKHRSHIQ